MIVSTTVTIRLEETMRTSMLLLQTQIHLLLQISD
jgi:hypothetical protein